MFIITMCANRGINGLFTKFHMDWARNVDVEKIEYEHPEFKHKVYKHVIRCFQESQEYDDVAPKYEVKPYEKGGWEHFYIKHVEGNEVINPFKHK